MMTSTRVKAAALIGAMIAMAASVASANEPASENERKARPAANPAIASYPIGLVFAAMDSNGDGATSREELALGTAKHWASFDGQERLGAIKFSQWSIRELGSIDAMPSFLVFDRDFSSTITQEEFETQLGAEFTRLDADGDDSLTREEMLFTVRRQGARGQGNRGQGAGGQGRRGQGGGGGKGGKGGGRGGGGRGR